MSNPARLLSELFSQPAEVQHGRPIRPLVDATNEIEARLESLAMAGVKTKPFERLPKLIRGKLKSVSDDTLSIVERISPKGGIYPFSLEEPDHDLLDLLSERLELDTFATPDTFTAIRALLFEVKNLVRADNSIDLELRLFISRTIIAIEKQIEDFEIHGDFQLREALVTLFGLLRTAEAQSEDSERWKNTWEKWGVPITQGLIAGLPQVAIGIGQIFAEIAK